jgi:hypothetical protein
MSSSLITSLKRLRFVLVTAVAMLAIAPLAQPALAGSPAPEVPYDIRVPSDQKAFLVGHAVGVQIYTCNPVSGGYAWSSAVPRADLYDDHGKVVATHFAGPSWQARDGSKVVAKRDVGVIVDTTAIPWLRLSRVSSAVGADGDRLTGTTYIQRINTTGGLTPAASACNAVSAGTATEVPYTADYVFYKALNS